MCLAHVNIHGDVYYIPYIHIDICICMCLCACMHACDTCMHVQMCVYMGACMYVCVSVRCM